MFLRSQCLHVTAELIEVDLWTISTQTWFQTSSILHLWADTPHGLPSLLSQNQFSSAIPAIAFSACEMLRQATLKCKNYSQERSCSKGITEKAGSLAMVHMSGDTFLKKFNFIVISGSYGCLPIPIRAVRGGGFRAVLKNCVKGKNKTNQTIWTSIFHPECVRYVIFPTTWQNNFIFTLPMIHFLVQLHEISSTLFQSLSCLRLDLNALMDFLVDDQRHFVIVKYPWVVVVVA